MSATHSPTVPTCSQILAPFIVISTMTLAIFMLGFGFGDERLRAASQMLGVLSAWTPLLAKGFVVDVLLALGAMTLGTILGVVLGFGASSKKRYIRKPIWLFTQFFRNSPGLVLLFAFAFALPYQFTIAGIVVPFPAEAKVIVSFALKISANVSEIVRGAVAAVHSGQWEASFAIGLNKFLTFRLVILPQCLRRMAAPWMNVAALFFTAVPVASLVGIYDSVAYAGLALKAEGDSNLIIPIYLYVLTWFFGIAYALQGLTRLLEARTQQIER